MPSSQPSPESGHSLAPQHYTQAKSHARRGDYKRALPLFRQAAKAGHGASANELAYCYSKGLGVKHNPSQAFKHFQKGARLADPSAMWNLACIYRDGLLDQPVNETLFQQWCLKAADAGLPSAQFEAGVCYRDGSNGFTSNFHRAVYYFNAAAMQKYGQGHGKNRVSAYLALKSMFIDQFT